MKRSLQLLALIVSASFCLQASALALTVMNTGDSGAGSLRQTLAAATDGDTINFDSSLNGQTIAVTSGQLVVNKSVTISGPGANQLTVQRSTDAGTPDFRIFYISSGKTVTISGLTITNGHPPSGSFPDDSGGAIYNDHAILTVRDCTLTGNLATWGGGIYNDAENNGSAALTVSNSTVSGNTSVNSGGGIYNDGENHGSATLAISNSTLTGNLANSGGGIYNDGENNGSAALTVNNSTLSVNSSGNSGGGIYNTGTLTVTKSTLSGNSAAAFGGGGIYNNGELGSATLTISNSTIRENSARLGGGIFNLDIFGATQTITSSTISGNSATGILGGQGGGGIFNQGSATLTITNSTISGNSVTSVDGSGGGIYNQGNFGGSATLKITNSTLSGNSASLGGGGILNDVGLSGISATLTIGDTILKAGASGANIFSSPSLGPTVISLGYNLSSDDASAFLDQTSDQNSTDPKLDVLAPNGGPTFTHALLAGSPAINAGTDLTALFGAIDNSTTSVTVTDATSIPAGVGVAIQIDSEQMIVTAKSGNTLTVTRGANGTTAAAHSNGAVVNPAFDQRGAGFARQFGSAVDIGAFEIGAVRLTTLGVASCEDFDTLASSGTSSTTPAGWAFSESNVNANTTYTAGNGSGATGDTYSFGSISSTDRAFGALQSNTLIPTVGAAFTNNTGQTIGSLSIAYTGEQWRLGAVGRLDRLDFQFSTDATSLTTGTWTDVDQLDFNAPTSTGTVGALDGNAAANRVMLTFTINGQTIADGATFWIRWTDFNPAGADDGLGIDDFCLTPLAPTPTVCPQPQGYWKNNPNAWPVNSLMLGSQTYTKAELITILRTRTGSGPRADASLILADQLIAAKLNIANGADDPAPVPSTITDADAVLSLYPGKLPYRVRPNTTNGQRMVSDANALNSYNNGLLTPVCTP